MPHRLHVLLSVALTLAGGCSLRIDLGGPAALGDGAPGVPDGGACPAVSGTFSITRAVGGCEANVTLSETLQVTQQGCDLVFPGPTIEGTAQFQTSNKWSGDSIKVGNMTGTCIAAYHEADNSLEVGCGGSVCYVVMTLAGGGSNPVDGGSSTGTPDGGTSRVSAFTYSGSFNNIVIRKADTARDLCLRLVIFDPWPDSSGSVFQIPQGWGLLEGELRDSAADCDTDVARPPSRDGGTVSKSTGIAGSVFWTAPDGGASVVPCTVDIHAQIDFPAGSPSTSERIDADALVVVDPDGVRPAGTCP